MIRAPRATARALWLVQRRGAWGEGQGRAFGKGERRRPRRRRDAPLFSALTLSSFFTPQEAAAETILTPRFYTTDFDEMEDLFSLEKNPNLKVRES